MKTSFVICVLVRKRILNNCPRVWIELFLSGLIFPYWERNAVFLFSSGSQNHFLVAGQNCFPFSHLTSVQLDPLSSAHLTLIKNHLRCPQCLTPPPNSNNFILLFFSRSSLAFFTSLPLYFHSLWLLFWLLI